MIRVVRAALALAVALIGAHAGADGPQAYGAQERVAHVRGAITAVAEAPAAALREGFDYARAMERGACSAGAVRLRVECLMVAARKYCQERQADRGCALYMDVVIANVLADTRLIPADRRYQIIRENIDYRPALAAELHRIQGALAVDFRLHAGDVREPGALAAAIDKYCLESADDTKLSYPICVSSLVWFIEGHS